MFREKKFLFISLFIIFICISIFLFTNKSIVEPVAPTHTVKKNKTKNPYKHVSEDYKVILIAIESKIDVILDHNIEKMDTTEQIENLYKLIDMIDEKTPEIKNIRLTYLSIITTLENPSINNLQVMRSYIKYMVEADLSHYLNNKYNDKFIQLVANVTGKKVAQISDDSRPLTLTELDNKKQQSKVTKKEVTDTMLSVENHKINKLSMIDVEGMSTSEAKQALLKFGFKEDNITEKQETSSEVDKGNIISQSIKQGTEIVPENERITLTISKGPDSFSLAYLAGYTREQVARYIDSEGLILQGSSQEYSSSVPQGQVLYTVPAGGTPVKKGDYIQVIYSMGPEPIKTEPSSSTTHSSETTDSSETTQSSVNNNQGNQNNNQQQNPGNGNTKPSQSEPKDKKD